MKRSELSEAIRQGHDAYIHTRWGGLSEYTKRSEERILSYLFAGNSGGLVAALAYVASRPNNGLLTTAIVFCSLGVVLILIHAAWTYYDAEGTFGKYRRDVDGYFEEKLDWEALVAKDEERSSGGMWGHILGWSSGVCLAIALFCGVWGVLKQAQPSLKSIANASSDP